MDHVSTEPRSVTQKLDLSIIWFSTVVMTIIPLLLLTLFVKGEISLINFDQFLITYLSFRSKVLVEKESVPL